MPVIVTCSGCNTKARVADAHVGRRVACPRCGQPIATTSAAIMEEIPLATPVAMPAPLPPTESEFARARKQTPDDPRASFSFTDEERSEAGIISATGGRVFRALPQRLPGGSAAILTVFLAIVYFIATALVFVISLNLRRDPPDPMWEQLARNYGNAITLVQIATRLSAFVLFLVWLYQAFENVKYFGARDLSYSPGWAVGCWFIPFCNLIMPLIAIQELWRASNPRNDITDPLDWKRRRPSLFAFLWWLVGIGSFVVGFVDGYIRGYAQGQRRMLTQPELDTLFRLERVNDGLSLTLTALFILLILRMVGRQSTMLEIIRDARAGDVVDNGTYSGER